MRVVRVDHMVWVDVLGFRTLFLLLTRASASLGRSGRYRRLPFPCITLRNYVNLLGTWNARGINGTGKGGGGGRFKEGKFELLALTETKLKGNREGVELMASLLVNIVLLV